MNYGFSPIFSNELSIIQFDLSIYLLLCCLITVNLNFKYFYLITLALLILYIILDIFELKVKYN